MLSDAIRCNYRAEMTVLNAGQFAGLGVGQRPEIPHSAVSAGGPKRPRVRPPAISPTPRQSEPNAPTSFEACRAGPTIVIICKRYHAPKLFPYFKIPNIYSASCAGTAVTNIVATVRGYDMGQIKDIFASHLA